MMRAMTIANTPTTSETKVMAPLCSFHHASPNIPDLPNAWQRWMVRHELRCCHVRHEWSGHGWPVASEQLRQGHELNLGIRVAGERMVIERLNVMPPR